MPPAEAMVNSERPSPKEHPKENENGQKSGAEIIRGWIGLNLSKHE
jgi:hypothetical protein